MGINYYFTYLRVVLKKKAIYIFLAKTTFSQFRRKEVKKKDALWCSYSICHLDHHIFQIFLILEADFQIIIIINIF